MQINAILPIYWSMEIIQSRNGMQNSTHNTNIYLFGYGTEYSTANFTEVTVVFIVISPKLVLVT